MFFKNNKRSLFVHALVLFLPVVFFGGCATDGRETATPVVTTKGPTSLRVGVSTNSPPMIFEKDDRILGLEADLARKFADYLGRPLEFVKLEWKRQIPALNAGESDIVMSGMTITEERKLRVAFTIPYFESGLMAMTREEDLRLARAVLENGGRRDLYFSIGVVAGTTGEKYVRENFENVRVVDFSTGQKALRDLIYGAIDMIVHDAPMIFAYKALNESKGLGIVPFMLRREKVGWAVRKSDPELLEQADAFLRMVGESGELQKMVDRWFPDIANMK